MRALFGWVGIAIVAVGVVGPASAQDEKEARGSLPQQPRYTLKDHRDIAWCVAFSPDGRTLLSCGGCQQAKLGGLLAYDLTRRRPDPLYLAQEGSGFRWVAFAADGKTLATAEYSG